MNYSRDYTGYVELQDGRIVRIGHHKTPELAADMLKHLTVAFAQLGQLTKTAKVVNGDVRCDF